MEDYALEEDIKEKYLSIYQNQNETFNLSQDNKYNILYIKSFIFNF